MGIRLTRTVILVLILVPMLAAARDVPRTTDYLPPGLSYSAGVPVPAAVLGFEVGEWHVRHDQLVQYMYTLAENSARVQIEETGRTHENRPLLLLTISSPDNLARLPEIREQHLRLSDPDADVANIEELPAVVWLGYSVHGNEASGSNAAMLVAYYLAAATGEEIDRLLEQTIILLDPSFNPDGLSRFAHWANNHRGRNLVADPNHREHVEAWPSGRTNHYWFDLNRDWLLLQHPESRARIRAFHAWRPNVLTDFHEMQTESTYFFQPGVPIRKHPLTPERNVELTDAIAQFHADALDDAGVLYFSEEVFDDFYYGKGSTYPDINGAIGILFEQASVRGHVQETTDGQIGFPFAIRNQFLTSLSTLHAVQALRTDLLTYQRDFYVEVQRDAARDPIKAYIVDGAEDPARAAHFLELLQLHGIEVRNLTRDVAVDGHEFKTGSAWILLGAQSQYRVLKALFETRTEFADHVFYDVSTWTLPHAFGLTYASMRDVAPGLIGARIDPYLPPGGIIADEGEPYAYAFHWTNYYAPKMLYRLLSEDVKARVALKPFAAQIASETVHFPEGSIVIPVGIQDQDASALAAVMAQNSREGVQVYTLTTGRSEAGVDLGSPALRPLVKPEPMLVVGKGVSTYDAGEVWYLLDHRMGFELPLIDVTHLDQVDLASYEQMILVDGDYEGLAPEFVDRLHRWLAAGGTLMLTKKAIAWAQTQSLFDPERPAGFVAEEAAEEQPQAAEEEPAQRFPYADQQRREAEDLISGAILAVDVDSTHPIGFGYDTNVSVFRQGTFFLEPLDNPYANVAVYSDNPLVSGYVSAENLNSIRASVSINAARVGKGSIVSFADNMNFRGFWYGTSKLFVNPLFFAGLIDYPAPEPESD